MLSYHLLSVSLRPLISDSQLWHAEQRDKPSNEIIYHVSNRHCNCFTLSRRMFPSMRVSLSGLEEEANYCVLLEMVPIGDCRYKFSGSQWVPAGGAEPQSPQRMFLHPDSPATGKHWQSQALLFSKVKLTNNTLDNNGHVGVVFACNPISVTYRKYSLIYTQIVLASMHKYQPRLHVIRTADLTQIPWAPQQAFVFPETEFIAVTAYQVCSLGPQFINWSITNLLLFAHRTIASQSSKSTTIPSPRASARRASHAASASLTTPPLRLHMQRVREPSTTWSSQPRRRPNGCVFPKSSPCCLHSNSSQRAGCWCRAIICWILWRPISICQRHRRPCRALIMPDTSPAIQVGPIRRHRPIRRVPPPPRLAAIPPPSQRPIPL